MNKLRIALVIVVVLVLAGRQVYWETFAGNTVHVLADDVPVTVQNDDEPDAVQDAIYQAMRQ